jgi:hypothetical protein
MKTHETELLLHPSTPVAFDVPPTDPMQELMGTEFFPGSQEPGPNTRLPDIDEELGEDLPDTEEILPDPDENLDEELPDLASDPNLADDFERQDKQVEDYN